MMSFKVWMIIYSLVFYISLEGDALGSIQEF